MTTTMDHDAGPAPRSTAAAYLGAATSLAVLAGMAVWGWETITREADGVPVIAALGGPMRLAPEDPGGRVMEGQGLAVNAVPAAGAVAAPPREITLAVPPIDLGAAADTYAARPADTAPAGTGDAGIDAIVSELLDGAETIDAPAAVPASAGGVVRSPMPSARPVRAAASASFEALDAAPALEAAIATSSRPAGEIDADTLPPGTFLAQLGAFPSAEIARGEWARLGRLHETYIDGRGSVIMKAVSGGRTFYRLRAAGFEDRASARRFCAALEAVRADCIPVETR